MSFFNNLKVNVKIFSGYLIALALMLGVGSLAIYRLNQMDTIVTELTTHLAVDRQLGNDIVAHILSARLYANKYIHTHAEQELENYNTEIKTLDALISQGKADAADPTHVARIQEIANGYVTYKSSFDAVRQAILEQDRIKTDILDVQGPLIDAKLNQWREKAFNANDLAAEYSIENVRAVFNALRLDAYQYIATRDKQYLGSFNLLYQETLSALSLAQPSIERLSASQLSSQQDYTELKQSIETYTAVFQQLETSYAQQEDVQTNALDLYGPKIHQDAIAIVENIEKDFEATTQSTSDLDLQTRWILLATMLIALVMGVGLGAIISRGITRPLEQVAQLAQQIAETDLRLLAAELEALARGDLTRHFIPTTIEIKVNSKDEVGMLARSFNLMICSLQGAGQAFEEMTKNLQTLVGEVASNATNVSVASAQLATAANQAGQATTQIAVTVQEVAKGTAQQAESATRTAAAVEQMSHAINNVAQGAQQQTRAVTTTSKLTVEITAAIQQVAGNAEMVSKHSNQAANAAQLGVQSVHRTVEGMTSIRTKVGLSAEKVKEMGQRSNQIGMIVETIEDIASQTNLLALNAAIEAARAGEHGKGFAVVADEVRKLAERAGAATKEIGSLINAIQATVLDAVNAMNEGAREVENGVMLVNQAGSSLNEIAKTAEGVLAQAQQAQEAALRMRASSNELVTAMGSVSSVVDENTSAVKEMASNSSEVTQAIETIASVSEENSAAIEQVSASAEEMSAQVEEVTAAAQSLADMASSLQAVVGQFKFNVAPARSGAR